MSSSHVLKVLSILEPMRIRTVVQKSAPSRRRKRKEEKGLAYLDLAKTSSAGFRLGEYGGKKHSLPPAWVSIKSLCLHCQGQPLPLC